MAGTGRLLGFAGQRCCPLDESEGRMAGKKRIAAQFSTTRQRPDWPTSRRLRCEMPMKKAPSLGSFFHYLCHQFFTNLAKISFSVATDITHQYSAHTAHYPR